jgi:hypothetical protein
MTPKSLRYFAVALMGTASISVANAKDMITPVSMRSLDGTYGVAITTRRGDCQKHHHWMILVSGGRVSSAGNTPMHASGHISPEGHVHLTFTRLHHVAKVTGRLTTQGGSGTWHSPTMECTGSWHARRRS